METQCSFSAGLCDKTTFSCLPGCVSTYNPESTEPFPSPFCPSHHLMCFWKTGISLLSQFLIIRSLFSSKHLFPCITAGLSALHGLGSRLTSAWRGQSMGTGHLCNWAKPLVVHILPCWKFMCKTHYCPSLRYSLSHSKLNTASGEISSSLGISPWEGYEGAGVANFHRTLNLRQWVLVVMMG